MIDILVQTLLYPALLVVLAYPFSGYMARAMNGEPTFLQPVLRPVECLVHRLTGINPDDGMDWKQYLKAVLAFSTVCLALLGLLLLLQHPLPLNPEGAQGMSWHLAFNTAVSFVTNTNWQSYAGERALSTLSQMAGLAVQNLVSPAAGLAVLFAFMRGLVGTGLVALGNFFVDVTRAILYIMLPFSLVLSLALVWQGVPQTFSGNTTAALLEPLETEQGTVTEQFVPLGPEASQVALKQLGTNGGGYNGTNSAHPHENPTPFSNILELLALLLIPAGLCFSFGRMAGDSRQGVAVFLAMFLLLGGALAAVTTAEFAGTPQLVQAGAVDLMPQAGNPGGNMEGKETRFGIAASSTWAAFTTAGSNGSVNAMLDSFTPLGGMIPMLLIQLGEVVFGGVGSGLYGMLGFAILAVFMAGLMVGRTPEYLGKKIGPSEMKMAVAICLATPVAILAASALFSLWPGLVHSMANPLPHGFSEMLYAASSAGGNNGSAFAGLNTDTPFANILLGVAMLWARFVPLAAALALAGSLAGRKKSASGPGTLSTCNGLFVFLLLMVVLLIGALSFLPALALGPLAEFLQM